MAFPALFDYCDFIVNHICLHGHGHGGIPESYEYKTSDASGKQVTPGALFLIHLNQKNNKK